MSKLYRIQFETVLPFGEGMQFYRGEAPTVKPHEVPDKFWTKTHRDTTEPWQQYNQLKEWAATGSQLIRNVELLEMVSSPEWKPVENAKWTL